FDAVAHLLLRCAYFFFFHVPAPSQIYTLSLHDALPISFVPEPMSVPRYLPESIGPPDTAIVGMSTLAAPISSAGVDIPTIAVSGDRKSTRLNSSHSQISYAVFCLKKKKQKTRKIIKSYK